MLSLCQARQPDDGTSRPTVPFRRFRAGFGALKRVQQYAEKIHMCVANDSKKLKDAELLMRRASFRLKDILNEASFEDRQALEAMLTQLNQVRAQLMTQVFKQ
jgi:hypothetical protein